MPFYRGLFLFRIRAPYSVLFTGGAKTPAKEMRLNAIGRGFFVLQVGIPLFYGPYGVGKWPVRPG